MASRDPTEDELKKRIDLRTKRINCINKIWARFDSLHDFGGIHPSPRLKTVMDHFETNIVGLQKIVNDALESGDLRLKGILEEYGECGFPSYLKKDLEICLRSKSQSRLVCHNGLASFKKDYNISFTDIDQGGSYEMKCCIMLELLCNYTMCAFIPRYFSVDHETVDMTTEGLDIDANIEKIRGISAKAYGVNVVLGDYDKDNINSGTGIFAFQRKDKEQAITSYLLNIRRIVDAFFGLTTQTPISFVADANKLQKMSTWLNDVKTNDRKQNMSMYCELTKDWDAASGDCDKDMISVFNYEGFKKVLYALESINYTIVKDEETKKNIRMAALKKPEAEEIRKEISKIPRQINSIHECLLSKVKSDPLKNPLCSSIEEMEPKHMLDIKRSGDGLQVLTAENHNYKGNVFTIFISGDYLACMKARLNGVPTIFVTFKNDSKVFVLFKGVETKPPIDMLIAAKADQTRIKNAKQQHTIEAKSTDQLESERQMQKLARKSRLQARENQAIVRERIYAREMRRINRERRRNNPNIDVASKKYDVASEQIDVELQEAYTQQEYDSIIGELDVCQRIFKEPSASDRLSSFIRALSLDLSPIKEVTPPLNIKYNIANFIQNIFELEKQYMLQRILNFAPKYKDEIEKLGVDALKLEIMLHKYQFLVATDATQTLCIAKSEFQLIDMDHMFNFKISRYEECIKAINVVIAKKIKNFERFNREAASAGAGTLINEMMNDDIRKILMDFYQDRIDSMPLRHLGNEDVDTDELLKILDADLQTNRENGWFSWYKEKRDSFLSLLKNVAEMFPFTAQHGGSTLEDFHEHLLDKVEPKTFLQKLEQLNIPLDDFDDLVDNDEFIELCNNSIKKDSSISNVALRVCDYYRDKLPNASDILPNLSGGFSLCAMKNALKKPYKKSKTYSKQVKEQIVEELKEKKTKGSSAEQIVEELNYEDLHTLFSHIGSLAIVDCEATNFLFYVNTWIIKNTHELLKCDASQNDDGGVRAMDVDGGKHKKNKTTYPKFNDKMRAMLFLYNLKMKLK